MNSVTARLKKAKEDRRRAETEMNSSQNPLAHSLLNAERSSQNSSSIPQFSGHKRSSTNSVSHVNQNAGHLALKVS